MRRRNRKKNFRFDKKSKSEYVSKFLGDFYVYFYDNFREIKELRTKQAKQSVEAVKTLNADKNIKKGERERCAT